MAFFVIAIGVTIFAYFFAKPILHSIYNFFIGISYIVALFYIVIHTGVMFTGRKNEYASKYNSYQEMDLSTATLQDKEHPTDEEKESTKKKAYETSSALWFYMFFIWLTPLLCVFHEDFRFWPMNAFNVLALISGIYIYFRQLANIFERFGDAYARPIPEKSSLGWFVLKCTTLLIIDLYYIAVLLVSSGVIKASTL